MEKRTYNQAMDDSKLDVSEITASLRAEREVLVARVAELSNDATTKGGYDSNFADSSAVIAERGEAETQYANLSNLLADVEAALTKLANNTYGICESCSKPIDDVRLEAIPTTHFCRDCAMQRRR